MPYGVTMTTSTPASTGLRGTPVVPGVAAGPALLCAARCRRRRSRASATAASPTPTPRWRPTTTRSPPWPTTFARKAGEGHRRRPPRCSPRAPGWRATRACAERSPRTSPPARRWCAAVDAAVEQFVSIFTNMGGLMAERVTDLEDIERRVVAHLVGEPEPGVPTPERAVGAGRRGPRAQRHRRPGPASRSSPWSPSAAAPTSHTAIIARQLGIPCVVGVAGRDGRRGRHRSWSSTARPASVEIGADPDEAARRVAASREARAALAAWTGPAETSDGTPVKLLANVADGPSAVHASDGAGAGRRPLPHRAVLPQRAPRSRRPRSRARSTPRCSTPSARGSTS